eukprot:TRINITY_DN3356_c0_g1_i4.p1 TRINITY_DN3356_c0_g1~~TRINITY_DN3356_c0_g1_i4.p1  ORF type:complete len:462 (+),score=91.73 TRINITY_DN3356_c0_g1_i4:67-1452(+)
MPAAAQRPRPRRRAHWAVAAAIVSAAPATAASAAAAPAPAAAAAPGASPPAPAAARTPLLPRPGPPAPPPPAGLPTGSAAGAAPPAAMPPLAAGVRCCELPDPPAPREAALQAYCAPRLARPDAPTPANASFPGTDRMRLRRLGVPAVAGSLWAPAYQQRRPQWPGTAAGLRIIPFGDSITQGRGVPEEPNSTKCCPTDTWRRYAHEVIQRSGRVSTMVGPLSAQRGGRYRTPDWPTGHCAVYGASPVSFLPQEQQGRRECKMVSGRRRCRRVVKHTRGANFGDLLKRCSHEQAEVVVALFGDGHLRSARELRALQTDLQFFAGRGKVVLIVEFPGPGTVADWNLRRWVGEMFTDTAKPLGQAYFLSAPPCLAALPSAERTWDNVHPTHAADALVGYSIATALLSIHSPPDAAAVRAARAARAAALRAAAAAARPAARGPAPAAGAGPAPGGGSAVQPLRI